MNKELRSVKVQKKLEEYYQKKSDVCFICERNPQRDSNIGK